MSNTNVETNTLGDNNKAPPPYYTAPQEPSPQLPRQRYPNDEDTYRPRLYGRCAQNIHYPSTKFGLCGIILAVICFPVGLICMFLDTHEVCSRCGQRL